MIWILNYYKPKDSKLKCDGKFFASSVLKILSPKKVNGLIIWVLLNFSNQREDDLRENHPFFDTPLFAVPRESKFRKICQLIVYARYDARLKDPLTGKERKVQYKSLQ